mmetsp:Transcript_278/g.645  ORF Transcript_278/g.645 Transcript_278/m.645 type:complete len:201 (+) Transcript_278:684-1286(+)
MPSAARSRASALRTRSMTSSVWASAPAGFSRSVASIHSTCNFRVFAMAAWCNAAMTDWYASPPPLLYFPTKAITTGAAASALSTCSAKPLQSLSERKLRSRHNNGIGATSVSSRRSIPFSKPTMCCSAKMPMTWNRFFTSCALMMRPAWMLHWFEIFFRVSSCRGSGLRQMIMSGCTPRASSAFTECCVGFVFCPLMFGM